MGNNASTAGAAAAQAGTSSAPRERAGSAPVVPLGEAAEALRGGKSASDDGLIGKEFAERVLLDIVHDVVVGPAPGASTRSSASSCCLSELLGLESGPEGESATTPPLDSSSPVLADRIVRVGDTGPVVRVIQPRVVKQPASTGICGYKALFNAVVANHYAGALVGGDASPGSPLVAMSRGAAASLVETDESSKAASGPSAGATSSVSTPDPASMAAAAAPAAAPSAACSGTALEGSGAARPEWFGDMAASLGSRAAFWRLFRQVRERLYDEAFTNWKAGGQPLREQRSLTGDVLERPHIRSIQRDPPSVLEDLCDNMTVCLEFGSSSFRQGSLPADVPAFLDAVARFRDEDAHHHSFLLGLATHWVAVTAIKLPAKRAPPGREGTAPTQSHEYSVILMDSENHRGVGHAATDVLRRVANFSVWDSTKPRYIPLSFEIPACVDTIEGIQAFVYLLARGITGTVDLAAELAHANTRGNLTSFPRQAWRPLSTDPIDADAIAAALGRTPLYSRRVRDAKQLEEMFPGRGAELRTLFARQEVADLEAGIARRPDPDDRALSAAEADAEWRASEATSRAIVAEVGASDDLAPCAWEALESASDDEQRRPHLDMLVSSCLQWMDTNYPLPLALRLLRQLRLDAAPAANAESLRDLESFGEMLGRAGWWSTQAACGVELSDSQRAALASIGEEGGLLASVASSSASL
ncbi:hypothetical protein FNF29_05034 [Cafeteria roenbergensis]|uniref:Uncharacterized protein n=1 Tax=Cafeteria roenbergensis TaxID=33653 RepID=A0A5A8CDL4_CAFRO|nr:hypothetical protein FNF29_05034 [Cafeteria roenbergensis]|eukprot:KAA0150697.1 hypothetical protein FNF29_05034 [Cafeteria roenbergensis]